MLKKLLRQKPLTHPMQETLLNRSLNGLDLTLLGIGAIIGAGVFVLTGVAAATKAGPAVTISYLISGFASMFAALAYAELASSIGGIGSAYNYAYTGFGEFIAWIIGWDLLLEYAMSVSTVAIGWSGYVNNLLEALHIHLPFQLTKNPFEGGTINLPAIVIILLLMMLLSLGIKHSVRFNAVIVLIKLITIAIFLIVTVPHINLIHWVEFFPFGFRGVMQGAALVFFAYIGFDALSTAVEETIEPARNVPIGIISSMVICTAIYIVVSAVLTMIVPFQILNVSSPVAYALLRLGHPIASTFIAAGAIAGLTTVMLVMYYGLTRIALSIARDGLLPGRIAIIHSKTRTPVFIIVLFGLLMAVVTGFVPIAHAAELVNIGTLMAFTLVCFGTIFLRAKYPDLSRPFKLPLHPLIPILGILFCIYLLIELPLITWLRFLSWLLLGIIIYFLYGYKHSLLSSSKAKAESFDKYKGD